MSLDTRRNRWLRRATTLLQPLFADVAPIKTRSVVVRVAGDDSDCLGTFRTATPIFPAHICIDRSVVESNLVLRVLAHELCHFATEAEAAAHGNAFRRVARGIGLCNTKASEAFWVTATPTLHRTLEQILQKLGPYPT
jgi:SprT-like family